MTARDVNGLSAERLEGLREAASGSTVGDEVFFQDDAGRTRVIGGGEELEAAIRAVRDREARANSPEAQAASLALMEGLEPRMLRHARYLAVGLRVLTGLCVQAMERQLGLDILPPDPAYRRPTAR